MNPNEFFNYLKVTYKIGNRTRTTEKFIEFIVNNDFFGLDLKDNQNINQTEINSILAKFDMFYSEQKGLNDLFNIAKSMLPSTMRYFKEFAEDFDIDEDSQFYILDFILYRSKRDIFLYNNESINELVSYAVDDLTKQNGDIFTSFLTYLKTKTKTNYHIDFFMKERKSSENNEAYDLNTYLKILYHLYNEEYNKQNRMYEKACDSKNYADTWLFLALHFVCALRFTDLERLPHPILESSPEETLLGIKHNTLPNNTFRKTINSITDRLSYLKLTPKKTSTNHTNIPNIQFNIPVSCEVHIGKLFSICEAHNQLRSPDKPLIRKISQYNKIKLYMGEDIGNLFLERDFSSRAANKSYLQALSMIADTVLKQDIGVNTTGYTIAALARSHKGKFGELEQITQVYLKESKINQLNAKMVVKQFFERGVLSMIPSMLLKIITYGNFEKYSPERQTDLIKNIQLTPLQVDNIFSLQERSNEEALSTVKNILQVENNPQNLLMACQKIGNDQAKSKQTGSGCMLIALNKPCPFLEKQNCLGCKYEIITRQTLKYLIEQSKTIKKKLRNLESGMEKEKNIFFLNSILYPKIKGILETVEENYDSEVTDFYIEMSQEFFNE